MGNVASSLTNDQNDNPYTSATRQLTDTDKDALNSYLHNLSEHTKFESEFLIPYLQIQPVSQSHKRLAILLYGDERTQADALYDISLLQTLRSLVEATCKDAVSRYWNTEKAIDPWFVDWVLTSTRTDASQMSGFPDDTDIEAKASVSQEWIRIASTQGGVTPAVWRKWWKDCTAFQELMEIALRSTDLFRRLLQQGGRTTVLRGIAESNLCSPLIPETDVSYFSGTKSNTGGQALLTPSLAWALVRELPDTSRHAWECIYSSKRDGRSWSTFQNAVERRGSVLLLVREKQPSSSASLVGTYIDMELFRKPTWHGTSDNMLFAIGPNEPERLAVFRATGFNNHYQYFNYATKTLPNGIGVGGQMGHFGLWIDSSFTRGSSSTAATFESRQLSHSSEFDVDVVEAWLVRPAKRDDDDDSQPKASAMDANPEAVALLEMANRTMYSKMMVREPDTSA